MLGMSALASTAVDLARIQFATTSLYHFIFVPLTLGLAPLVATMQTIWHRTGDEAWLKLTRFFGTLLLINFAIGVATGLVQEFQFGMHWSVDSNYVGNIFGAPLALAGLTVGATVVFGVACWHLARGNDRELFLRAAKLALIVLVPVSAGNLWFGSHFGIYTTETQPMKIAATEALWDTQQPASFSLF